jgi:hypothetical protein
VALGFGLGLAPLDGALVTVGLIDESVKVGISVFAIRDSSCFQIGIGKLVNISDWIFWFSQPSSSNKQSMKKGVVILQCTMHKMREKGKRIGVDLIVEIFKINDP